MAGTPNPGILAERFGREHSFLGAAMLLAQYGMPVFPCVPGTKRPAVKRGYLIATTDLQQVGAWWWRWPTANLAVPTDAASWGDVVDVDRYMYCDGLEGFWRISQAGQIADWAALVTTRSDGFHVLSKVSIAAFIDLGAVREKFRVWCSHE